MNVRAIAPVVAVFALLTLGVKQAHADWLVSQITPRALSVEGRTFQVAVKDVRGAREFTVTLQVAPTAQPVRPSSRAALRLVAESGR